MTAAERTNVAAVKRNFPRNASFVSLCFLKRSGTHLDVRRAVGGQVNVEAVVCVTAELLVHQNHPVVLHGPVRLKDGTHGWQGAHVPLNVVPRDVWGRLDERTVVLYVQDAERYVIFWIFVKTKGINKVLRLLSIPLCFNWSNRSLMPLRARQTEWGNWMDLRTDASLLTVSTLKMGPAHFHELGRNAPNLDQDKMEYRTRTRSFASKTRPVTEHSYVPSPSSCNLKNTHTHSYTSTFCGLWIDFHSFSIA